jgi:hypothetical protein
VIVGIVFELLVGCWLFTTSMPNSWSWGFDYHLVCIIVMLTYIPGQYWQLPKCQLRCCGVGSAVSAVVAGFNCCCYCLVRSGLPNSWNWGCDYHLVCIIVMLTYIPGAIRCMDWMHDAAASALGCFVRWC